MKTSPFGSPCWSICSQGSKSLTFHFQSFKQVSKQLFALWRSLAGWLPSKPATGAKGDVARKTGAAFGFEQSRRKYSQGPTGAMYCCAVQSFKRANSGSNYCLASYAFDKSRINQYNLEQGRYSTHVGPMLFSIEPQGMLRDGRSKHRQSHQSSGFPALDLLPIASWKVPGRSCLS